MPRRIRTVGWLIAVTSVLLARTPAAGQDSVGPLVAQAWQRAADRLSITPAGYPMYTLAGGQWHTTSTDWWTSGFFPGALWMGYELTGNLEWRSRANSWTVGLQNEQYQDWSQDVGFIMYCSYGNGYRLTGDAAYRNVMLTAAQSLASRYNSNVGCVRASGNKDATAGDYRVIIDCMPCLELLLWGSQNGGPQVWRDMAVSHSARTAAEFIRPDGGSYHVVQFDTATGVVLRKETHQGYSAESTWSRGQAWGVYGFTMVYRYTRDPQFLLAAQRLADYFISHLPADHVPYWDFNAPEPNPVRDSSAGAITCAGLLELSTFVKDAADRAAYWTAAEEILGSLCSSAYLSSSSSDQGILLHGTYNYNENTGVDASLIWGDYYFMEALSRYTRLTSGSVLHRINCGGPILASADGSLPTWAEDSSAHPSSYLNAPGATAARPGASVVLDSSVPAGAPPDLFRYERYDPPGDADMQWSIPVTAGLDVEVRLLFAEMFTGITGPGQRVFNLSIEGQPALTSFDIFAEAGPGTGIMRSFPVTVGADGDIDIALTHVTENPMINGIEIVTSCAMSADQWQNRRLAAKSGVFVIEFDAVPMDLDLDALVGFSDAAGAGPSDFAAAIRFNPSGFIDARDGGAYRADRVVPYSAGAACSFRTLVDVPSHRYSVWTGPVGGSLEPLITDAAFRTEQEGISFVGNWGLQSSAGRLKVRDLVVSGCEGGIADFNEDCRVDDADFDHFAVCALGPGIPQSDPACTDANLDGDALGQVDQEDFAILQACWNELGLIKMPNCIEP